MKLSKKTVFILIVILLALVMTAAIVAAAEISTADAIAALDMNGAEGLFDGTTSATDHRLISPWSIDTGRSSIMVLF